jgi:YHS domain-containing protein
VIEERDIDPGEDPVCAMRVDVSVARATNLVIAHGDVEYAFCSGPCLEAFRDDPAWFLDRSYIPTRM